MKSHLCANVDCRKRFEPAFGQEETQKYCSFECGNRQRVRNCRARHKLKPNGGGPGSKRQSRLFPASAMNRRTKPKPEVRLKQDDLFPEDGQGLFASLAGGVEYSRDASGNEQVTCYRTRKASASVPAHKLNQPTPEAPLAA